VRHTEIIRVDNTILVFRVCDKKIKHRSITDSKRFRQWTEEWGTNSETRRNSRSQTTNDIMEDEPQSRPNSWVKFHVSGPTHVSHEDACTTSSMHTLLYMLELHALPLSGLRIKTYLSHHFGIIINYYSQGLKPLSLVPLSNLSAPFPLPTLWKLSPPSLFLRGWSARSDV
jgi:hypothetical protein